MPLTYCAGATERTGKLHRVQFDKKCLRMIVQDIKDQLMEGDLTLYKWVPIDQMLAHALTKEIEIP